MFASSSLSSTSQFQLRFHLHISWLPSSQKILRQTNLLSINITQIANKLQLIQQSNHVLRGTFIHNLVSFLPTLRRQNIRKGIHPIPTTLFSYKCLYFPSNHPSITLRYFSSHFFHLPHTFPWKEVKHGDLWLEVMVFPNHIGKKKHAINSYISHGLLGYIHFCLLLNIMFVFNNSNSIHTNTDFIIDTHSLSSVELTSTMTRWVFSKDFVQMCKLYFMFLSFCLGGDSNSHSMHWRNFNKLFIFSIVEI